MFGQNRVTDRGTPPTFVALNLRRWAVPVLLAWIGVVLVTNTAAPQLEVVGEAQATSMSSSDAPSAQAMSRIGKVFQEFDSDSSAMILLESDQPLGAEAHRYYDELLRKLEQDPTHVQHIENFWGDPLTADAAQSKDGKAALVQLYLAGNVGDALSTESVKAVRAVVADTPPRGCAPTSPAAHPCKPT